MSAYYNEFDPQKAAWLRELIKLNLIAPGDVDERSITDIRPDDLRGYAQCHFFAGIGIWSYAFRLAKWPDDREVWSGSCPCQPFSAAGKRKAFDDERHIWSEFFRLIQARRPITCFGEQVSSIDGLAWFDVVQTNLDDAGYTCGVLDTCAASVGAPHRRQRLYWVADCPSEGLERPTGEIVCGIGNRLASSSSSSMADSPETRRTRMDNANIDRKERFGSDKRIIGVGCETNQLAYAVRSGLVRRRVDNDSGAQDKGRNQTERSDYWRISEKRSIDVPPRGPINGFWANCDWVLTRPQRVGDRPGLRPVEPGAFPLAHGTSARVGRLRGYGDGIVAQAAQAFIEAYMELTQ